MTVPAEHQPENDKPDLEPKATSGGADTGSAGSSASDARASDAVDAGPAKPASDADAGKALATAGAGPVNPFLAAASEHAEAPDVVPVTRSLASRMLDYSAHAAIIVGLIGFAWTVGDHVVNRSASVPGDAVPSAASAPQAKQAQAAAQPLDDTQTPKHDEMSELRQSNQKMHDEIRALRASLETLRNVVRRDTTPEQVRMLSAGLDGVNSNLGAMRSETSSAIAQLNTKVDKLQPGKVRDLSDRVVRLEHQATDTTSTASIPHADTSHAAKSAPKPPIKPASLTTTVSTEKAASDDKPQMITAWSVRDVYQGVALVENKRGGTMEVVPGTAIPGAGVVKSIDRHGNGWTVTTSKGQFASAAPVARPSRPQYGRGYGYGYGYGYGPGSYRYGY